MDKKHSKTSVEFLRHIPRGQKLIKNLIKQTLWMLIKPNPLIYVTNSLPPLTADIGNGPPSQ